MDWPNWPRQRRGTRRDRWGPMAFLVKHPSAGGGGRRGEGPGPGSSSAHSRASRRAGRHRRAVGGPWGEGGIYPARDTRGFGVVGGGACDRSEDVREETEIVIQSVIGHFLVACIFFGEKNGGGEQLPPVVIALQPGRGRGAPAEPGTFGTTGQMAIGNRLFPDPGGSDRDPPKTGRGYPPGGGGTVKRSLIGKVLNFDR